MVFALHYVQAIARHLSQARASNIQLDSADFVNNFSVSAQVDEKTVRFAYWFAEHCDLVWSNLDMGGSAYQAAARARMGGEGSEEQGPLGGTAAPATPHPVPATPGATPVVAELQQELEPARVKAVRDARTDLRTHHTPTARHISAFMAAKPATWAMFLGQGVALVQPAALLAVARVFLRASQKYVWYTHTGIRALCQKAVADAGGDALDGHFLALAASSLLTQLGFGQLQIAPYFPGGGRRVWCFHKQEATPQTLAKAPLDEVRLGLQLHEHSTPTLQAFCLTTVSAAAPPSRATALVGRVVPHDDWRLLLPALGLHQQRAAIPVQAGLAAPHALQPLAVQPAQAVAPNFGC